MNSTLSKVLKFFLGGLLLVGVLLSVFYFQAVGNISPEASISQQEEIIGGLLDSFMYYAYFLVIAAIVITLAFAIIKMILDPKTAIKSLITLVILGIIVAISWAIADDNILNIPGYTGPDNVKETLKLSGMILWTSYITSAIALVVWVVAESSRAFK